MTINNQINSPTSSTGWAQFTTLISATVTPPTAGTIATNLSYYLQMGKLLYVIYNFKQTTGGTNGSGTYFFNIPSGFTINSAFISGATYPVFGSAALRFSTANNGVGTAYFFDATHYAILSSNSGTTLFETVSSTFYGMGTALSYSVSLIIPIT